MLQGTGLTKLRQESQWIVLQLLQITNQKLSFNDEALLPSRLKCWHELWLRMR